MENYNITFCLWGMKHEDSTFTSKPRTLSPQLISYLINHIRLYDYTMQHVKGQRANHLMGWVQTAKQHHTLKLEYVLFLFELG